MNKIMEAIQNEALGGAREMMLRRNRLSVNDERSRVVENASLKSE